ncbi:AraC family transcriptional regulator [Allohahella marinimesophila]|uniref:AraC family transcriptional regulator n=1 Tax=Allohahella marinimesophila TaxID=1054972 RepID=A0ABP7PGY1_9GAMM
MTIPAKPVFWRDSRLSHVELRKVADGRQVRYAPHSHKQWSIGAITEGQSTFHYRNDRYRVGAGDLVFMNPGWVHDCNPIDNQAWAYYMMHLDTVWLTKLRFTAGLLPTPHWQDLPTAVLSTGDWHDRYCNVAACLLDASRALLVKQTVLAEFLSDLMHELAKQPIGPDHQAPASLKKLAGYLDSQATEDVSLDVLCKRSGYSAGYLIRAFKQHFGLTPHAYLINRRIQLGQGELRCGIPIAEVALNAGFADQPHFQRTFKRLVAATPNEYRISSIDDEIDTARSQHPGQHAVDCD